MMKKTNRIVESYKTGQRTKETVFLYKNYLQPRKYKTNNFWKDVAYIDTKLNREF